MKAQRGRRSKLTPDVQAVIVRAIRDGYTLGSAARLADVSRSEMFLWLKCGRTRKSPKLFSDFSDAVRAAQNQAATAKIKANPRPLARARYERDEQPEVLQNMFYTEILRCQREGRVPYVEALRALEMAADELRDRLADESLSWVDECTPTHGGDRGRA